MGAAPFVGFFWFLIPTAVSVVASSKYFPLKMLPAVSAVLSFYSLSNWNLDVPDLDALALVLFYTLGLILFLLKKYKRSFVSVLMWPHLGAFIAAALIFVSSYLLQAFYGQDSTNFWSFFEGWSERQVPSDIFSYVVQTEGASETTLNVYESLLLPMMRSGIFAWFAAILGMAFFVNAVLENIFADLSSMSGKSKFRTRVRQEFTAWKAPDWALVGLVAGLAALSLTFLWKTEPAAGILSEASLKLIGWHLVVLSIFPIFLQGVALASFFIPRLGPFFLVLVCFLLIFNSIPVLVLAGLSDLWFDFRSRIRSNPESDEH